MSDRKNFEMAIQEVKASFFDTLYREQRLVHVLTDELNNYSDSEQQELKKCLVEQSDLATNLVEKLEEVDIISDKLSKISDRVQAIIGNEKMEIVTARESSVTVGQNVENQVEDVGTKVMKETTEVTAEIPSAKEEATMAAPASVPAERDTNSFQVVSSGESAEVSTEKDPSKSEAVVAGTVSVPSETAEDTTNSQAVSSSESTDVSTEMEPSKSETVVAETVSVPSVTAESQGTNVIGISNNSEEKIVNGIALPEINASGLENKEVTSISNSTMAPTSASDIQSATKADSNQVSGTTETVPFALSPIDEGVTKVAGETTNNFETPVATETAGNGEVLKVFKSDANMPKAILVTIGQFNKLTGSRETQKALMSVKGTFGVETTITPIATTGVVNEQVVNACGDLVPSTDTTKKEMEEIIAQANALYKEGKTTEAQVLYDQVSAMNKTLQATPAESAKVLVNTYAAPSTQVA